MSYEDADYYAIHDHERLRETTPMAAIKAEGHAGFNSPVIVTGYRRVELDAEALAPGFADDAIERIGEWLDDNDLSDPDGCSHYDNFSTVDLAAAKESLADAYRTVLGLVVVWHCEECGYRTYSPEEIRALCGGDA
jgi:hypothetical protein